MNDVASRVQSGLSVVLERMGSSRPNVRFTTHEKDPFSLTSMLWKKSMGGSIPIDKVRDPWVRETLRVINDQYLNRGVIVSIVVSQEEPRGLRIELDEAVSEETVEELKGAICSAINEALGGRLHKRKD